MLSRLSAISSGGKLWRSSQHTIQRDYQRTRKLLSRKLGNPDLNKISMKTFRHWKATTEYHRTKDILYVQRILGHKSLKNTLVYTHLLENDIDDTFTVKVTSTIEDFTKLLEFSFEYVSDYEGKKILRKRK
jgi:hypothetical protein